MKTKTFKVVMITTEKASKIFISNDELFITPNNNATNILNNNYTNQHLYIISNDEIKEGDWCICLDEIKSNKSPESQGIYINPLVQWKSTNNCNGCKKIVATTDKSLNLPGNQLAEDMSNPLPKIPESFIQAYIKSYNDGKVIEEVDLEILKYENHIVSVERIKTRPDNTVIVHQSKLCNKSDIKRLIILEREHRFNTGHFIDEEDLDKWIEEDLDKWIEDNL